MEQPSRIQVKFKYLKKVKVMTMSKGDNSLSSMEELRKLIYKSLPELEEMCENSCAWKSWKLNIQCKDEEEDFVTIENDGDLQGVVEWETRNQLCFYLDVKTKNEESTKYNWDANARSPSLRFNKWDANASGSSPGFNWDANASSSSLRFNKWDANASDSFPRFNWDANASSSSPRIKRGEISPKEETLGQGNHRTVPCRYYNFGRGSCRNGMHCTFAHNGNVGGASEPSTPRHSTQLQSPAWNILQERRSQPTNMGLWLKQQYERDPIENITFLSRDKGFEMIGKIVEEKNLKNELIEDVVKLLTRDEFRLSLMRESTNKVFGLLIGSAFILQLHGHIMTQLKAAEPHQIMPYLLLIEELQSRTTDGWKQVPLDAINNIIQKLEEGSGKKEVVTLVSRLIDHRNKLDRQAALSPSDENQFLGVEFRNMSIVPEKRELLQPHMCKDLPVNVVGKRYGSTVKYLETHFRLLREDCIDPLRQGIKAYRRKQSSKELRIYPGVQLVGYRCGDGEVENVVQINDKRTNWEQSKRLIYGALVCLSFDGFRNSFICGVVKGRDFKVHNRYIIWIQVMGSSEGEAVIVSDRKYIMVESTTAYFEAYYHVLKNLQREDMETIPFTKYLLDLQQQVDPPLYLQRREESDEFDFRPVFPTIREDIGKTTFHILQDWPQWKSTLDEAQLQALKHGLTKEVAIIQGPPGTGKTFLGLLLVRLLLANFKLEEDILYFQEWGINESRDESYRRKGPIIVICMTNHALDQFLEGIFKFETNLIRIGGRSKSEVLLSRTLKELLDEGRKSRNETTIVTRRAAKGRAWYEKANLEKCIQQCIKKLNAQFVKAHELLDVATEGQRRSLFSIGLNSRETVSLWLAGGVHPGFAYTHDPVESDPFSWTTRIDSESEELFEGSARKERSGQVVFISRPSSPGGWLPVLGRTRRNRRAKQQEVIAEGTDGVDDPVIDEIPAMGDIPRDNFQRGVQLQEGIEAGAHEMDDIDQVIDEIQAMGDFHKGDIEQDVQLQEDMGGGEDELEIQHFVDFADVWWLNQEQRGRLHEHWLNEVNMRYRKELQVLIKQYQSACRSVREIDDDITLSLLRNANVVGLTTTTAGRYHDILKALKSEIIIVEEAAEVLEGHVLSCLSSCVQHLVLIGDHLQLRPSTAVYTLGTKHNLDVSMFERLVKGGVEHVTLQEQRRMRPSFSKLVRSLYPNLKDHESVTQYEDIRGVASNLLFFDHTEEENSTTVDSSKVNTVEAKLVVELTLYLLKQSCYSPANIAILTMYNGQILEIKNILKERAARGLSRKFLERLQKEHGRPVSEDDDDHWEENEGEVDLEKHLPRVSSNKDDGVDLAKLLPRVSSVDDFQGEEADIIILSLVRSNDIQTNEGEGTIGFLKTSNRVCVALTRAKKGMYIFGNATLLAKRSTLWRNVIGGLRKDNALATQLELCCQNHPDTKTVIGKEEDFKLVTDGGCSRPCEVQLDCGHVCPRRCHPGTHDDVVCPKPCLRKYPDCLHTCTKVCHGMPCHGDCPPCGIEVIKTFTDCGHSQSMKCSLHPDNEICRSSCPKTLECGHMCAKVCGLPCTEECVTRVPRDSECGHTIIMPCSLDPETFSCYKPCGEILPDCEHLCQGTCSLCKKGTDHIPCMQKCGKTLPCGHACDAGCSVPCPPCKKPCQKRCVHSKCPLLCGQMCLPCRETCAWQCEHQKCGLLCHEICTRPRCNVPCRRVLACHHPCIGLCGDPCPSKCRTCDGTTLDIITQMTLEEYEETDRFCELQDCKHVFEVSGLDTWIDSDDYQAEDGRKSAAVKLKECPQCKMPVWRSTRYANVVKTRQAKLEAVKKKMFGYEKTKEGQVKLREGDHVSAYALFHTALQQNPTFLVAHFGIGCALCAGKRHGLGAVFLSFVVANSSYAAEVGSVLKDTKVIEKRFRFSKADCCVTKDDLAVTAMLQLASALTELKEFTSAEKLCDAVIKSDPRNRDATTIRDRAKKGLIAEVVQVMSAEVGEKGHWYECPNGHYYTIGECGGAMETAICPDCKATVGGGQHKLTTGNTHSTIDGSMRSAWPGH